MGLGISAARPVIGGLQIHKGDPLLDPIECQGARRLAAIGGRAEDDAIAGKRLMPVCEQKEVLRVVEQPFFIDIAMVVVIEAVIDRFD